MYLLGRGAICTRRRIEYRYRGAFEKGGGLRERVKSRADPVSIALHVFWGRVEAAGKEFAARPRPSTFYHRDFHAP